MTCPPWRSALIHSGCEELSWQYAGNDHKAAAAAIRVTLKMLDMCAFPGFLRVPGVGLAAHGGAQSISHGACRGCALLCAGVTPDQRIEAPRAASREREIKKNETEEDGGVSAIGNREEARWRMAHEIRERHLAGHDQRCQTREVTDGQQCAGDELDDAGDPKQGKGGRHRARRGPAKKL